MEKALETKIKDRILLGQNFHITSKMLVPKSKTARRRYTFTLRPHDNQKYRFYAAQISPGCVHIHFEEAK